MMNSSIDTNVANQLKDLYGGDDAFRRIVSWFNQRQKDSREMPVRVAAYRTGLDEREVRRVFKKLEHLGCGRFIKGRGENTESRMAWRLSIGGIASAAKGETSKIEEVEVSPEETIEAEEEEREASEECSVSHTFKIRSDFDVLIKLPHDFTEGEAERLSRFLKAIPPI